MGTQTAHGRQLLAVANDDNQLAFVAVDSPTSTLGSLQNWKAEVLIHSSLEPEKDSIFRDPVFFDDLIKQQRFISHVAWSPWVTRSDCFQSVVVYATNGDVRGRLVTYSNGSITLCAEVIYADIDLRHNGPISWCPRVNDGDKLTLALFSNSGLVYFTILGNDASIVNRVSHDLDGRWDPVSGVVWDYEQHPSPRLHFSSLLSTVHSPTAVLEHSSGELISLKAPNWREKIENSLVLFSVKNDLKGHSKTKVWGLTPSPLGDFIAACNSLHPSDSIEYGPPADRRGTVALSTLRQYSKIRESFPTKNTTAEGLLFTLKKLVENTVEDADQMPAFAKEAVSKLMQAYGPSKAINPPAVTDADDFDLEELVIGFKNTMVLEENTLRDRYTILVSYACNDTSSNDLARTLIAYRLAIALQKLPSALSQPPFSMEILLQHKQLVTLIDDLIALDNTRSETAKENTIGAANGSSDVTETIEKIAEKSTSRLNITAHSEVGTHRADDDTMVTEHPPDKANSKLHSQSATADLPALHPAVAATDQCDFCSAPIPFTDLTTATCTNGHQFPRCGLSLLAIQAPGITKYCGICSTPFLSEEFVQAQERSQGAEGEFSVMLSRILFQACDVCIYCGGKFVG